MPYSNEAIDSLHILPLEVMPLQTQGLQRFNLVKNSSLRSVVELFQGEQSGSGQIEIDDLGLEFEALKDRDNPDLSLLTKLSRLPSYDVYSLRITLRQEGIPLGTQKFLRLSGNKQAELASFMHRFTQPLVEATFAPEPKCEPDDFGLDLIDLDGDDGSNDLSGLINDSSPELVIARLERFAAKLQIGLEEVPKFLDDFADLYLSMAYYEACYTEVAREFEEFSDLFTRLSQSSDALSRNKELMRRWAIVNEVMALSKTFIQNQLVLFESQTREFWNDVSADRFCEIERMLKASHVRLGEILCGMTVKITPWRRKFASRKRVNPSSIAEFIMFDLGQGIEKIYKSATKTDAVGPLKSAGRPG